MPSPLTAPPILNTPCIHCASENPANAGYCASCGKALPGAARSGPRIVNESNVAGTRAGRTLQAVQLRKKAGQAATALFVVGGIQTLVGIVLATFVAEQLGIIGVAIFVGIGVTFLGLGFWALRNPLPAAICGLVLYLTLHGADALIDPASLGRGLILKAIIVGMLVSAISAGHKYRQLQRSGDGGAEP